jgi:hypothetical protein
MERSAAPTPAPTRADWLLRRWDRVGIGIRCAYNPYCACGLRAYLQIARQVIASGVRPEVEVHRRTVTVLLQTARDAALPWPWRSVCLDHAALPLARLRTLLAPTDAPALEALDGAVQAAADEIDAVALRASR